MKNKRWKREAKRLKGKCDDFEGNCFFCKLTRFECKNSCCYGIRDLEKLCKK